MESSFSKKLGFYGVASGDPRRGRHPVEILLVVPAAEGMVRFFCNLPGFAIPDAVSTVQGRFDSDRELRMGGHGEFRKSDPGIFRAQ
jgi:hypothetical protein